MDFVLKLSNIGGELCSLADTGHGKEDEQWLPAVFLNYVRLKVPLDDPRFELGLIPN